MLSGFHPRVNQIFLVTDNAAVVLNFLIKMINVTEMKRVRTKFVFDSL